MLGPAGQDCATLVTPLMTWSRRINSACCIRDTNGNAIALDPGVPLPREMRRRGPDRREDTLDTTQEAYSAVPAGQPNCSHCRHRSVDPRITSGGSLSASEAADSCPPFRTVPGRTRLSAGPPSRPRGVRPARNEPCRAPGWRCRVLVSVRRGVRNRATPAELNYVEPRRSSPQPQLWGAWVTFPS